MTQEQVTVFLAVEDPVEGEIEVECVVDIEVDRGGRDFPPSISGEFVECLRDASNGQVSRAIGMLPYDISDADAERAVEKAIKEYQP